MFSTSHVSSPAARGRGGRQRAIGHVKDTCTRGPYMGHPEGRTGSYEHTGGDVCGLK
jgi:hypothetical protein